MIRCFLFLLILLPLSGMSQGIDFQDIGLAEALAKAKEEDKRIFVELYTNWCGNCKKLERDIFTNAELGNYYNESFINLRYNAEHSEDGRLFARIFHVAAFPRMIFLDENGVSLMNLTGYKEVSALNSIAKHVVTIESDEALVEAINSGDNHIEKLIKSSGQFIHPIWPDLLSCYYKGLSLNEKQTHIELLNSQFGILDTNLMKVVIDSLSFPDIFAKNRVETIRDHRRIQEVLESDIDRIIRFGTMNELHSYQTLLSRFKKRTVPAFDEKNDNSLRLTQLMSFHEYHGNAEAYGDIAIEKLEEFVYRYSDEDRKREDNLSLKENHQEITYPGKLTLLLIDNISNTCNSFLNTFNQEKYLEKVIQWSDKAIAMYPRSIHYLQKARALKKLQRFNEINSVLDEGLNSAYDAVRNQRHFDFLRVND